MNEVWIVTHDLRDYASIVGVFSTEKLARFRATTLNQRNARLRPGSHAGYSVTNWTIDDQVTT